MTTTLQTLKQKYEEKNKCEYDDKDLAEIKKKMIPDEKIAVIMIGVSASGKSTLKKKFIEIYLKKRMNEFVDCDSDFILEELKKIHNNANKNCYYNGSEINDIIYTFAQRNNLNIILDGTGSDYIWTSGQIENLYHIGYTIYICIVKVDLEVAISRAQTRESLMGRVVPQDKIRNIFSKLEESLPIYIANKRAKEIIIYDNSGKKGEAEIKIYKNGFLTSQYGTESELFGFEGGRKKSIRRRKSITRRRTNKNKCNKNKYNKNKSNKNKYNKNNKNKNKYNKKLNIEY